MEFWRLYRVLRQRRKLILAVTAAAIIAGLVAGQHRSNDYSATATLTLPTVQQFYFVSGMGSDAGAAAANSGTLIVDMIRSREVANRVIQQLQLPIPPDELEGRITISQDPNTPSVFRITATGQTPYQAVTIANAFADNVAAYDQETQRQQATLAREFVEKNVNDTQTRLADAENQLLAFQQHNGTVLATGASAVLSNLQADARQIDFDIQAQTARLDALARQMNGQPRTQTNQLLFQNPVAQQLEGQLIQLQVQLTSQLAIHTESYPGVVAMEATVQAIKDRLNTEVSKIISAQQVVHNPLYDALSQQRVAGETDLLALDARKQAVASAIAGITQQLPGTAQTQMDQARLTRTADILTQQLTNLQNQLAQANLHEQEVQNIGSLSVLDHARSAAQSPLGGLRFKLMIALVLGLLGGVALAFFLEYLDNRLKTPEAAERLLGVPALVAIPSQNPPFDEAYRMLRINLGIHERGDVITLTSLKPRSGTSTVVANLARAFAQAGKRTIVVDAAFSSPAQHRLFDVPNERGLAQVLAGDATIADVLAPAGTNLWVVPSGPEPCGESRAYVGNGEMTAALAALRQAGDVVLIDTASAGAFADAFDLAPLTSGVLLVVDANQVPRGVEEQIKLQFDRLQTPVIGAVLTKVAPSQVDSYFYQERFYNPAPRRRLTVTPTMAVLIGFLLAAALIAGRIAWMRSDARAATVSTMESNLTVAVRAVQHDASVSDFGR